jgi:ABC-type transport system involved in multi-copper enzyme maturation permease subunit
LCLGLVIDAAYCVAHAIAGEIRGQTLSTLMMLPHSPARIIYSKLAGALLGWLPGLALLVVMTALFERTSRNLGDLLDEEVFYWLFANALCGVHLSALLATFVRWGAVAFGLGTQFLSMFLGVLVMESVIRGSEEEFILFVWTPCLVFLMIGLNVLLVARFQKLAEQG